MPAKDDESQIATKGETDRTSEIFCPWEQRFEQGHLRAYWLTIKGILFQTSDFFSKLSAKGPYWEPVGFALVTMIVASLGVELWAMLKDWASIDPSQFSSLRMKVAAGKFALR